MGEGFAFSQIASEPAEDTFRREKKKLIIRMLLLSTVVIFAIETVLMLLFEYLLAIPKPVILVLDGFVLVLSLFPFIYIYIVRPLAVEIDAHRRTNLELAKSTKILERFFSIADISIAYLDSKFNLIRVNQAYANEDESSPRTLLGKNHFDLYPSTENQAIFETVVHTGRPYYTIEKPFYYPNNPERGVSYWDWSLLPIRNPFGEVIELLLVLNNVTDRKQAQLERREIERRFQAVFNQTFQNIALLSPTGQVQIANQTALDFTGLRKSKIEGEYLWQVPWWDATPDETKELQAAVHQAALGQVARGEFRMTSGSGEHAVMDITIKPLLDDSGKPVMLIYEARDITQHIKSEEALQHSEEEIRRLYLAETHAHRLAETLRATGLDLSETLDSHTVFEKLLNHLLQVVPYESAHIFLVDDTDQLTVHVARGEGAWPENDRLLGKRFDLDNLPPLRLLLEDAQTKIMSDLVGLNTGLETRIDPVSSWLGLPLLAGEQVIGICTLEHTQPGYFTAEHVRWADALACQAAIAIQNAWLFEQVRDNRERLQALSHRLVEIQENERHYIARELHDEAGQALASIMVGLRLLEQESKGDPAIVARCRELKSIADGVLENLHRLAIDLRPASLDHLGLVAALQQHLDKVSLRSGLTIQFDTVGKIERLPGEIETAIYRIVQEAMTNILRHSQAKRASILLHRRKNTLLVLVEDDGIGFDLHQSRAGQLGMLGMRERADTLDGNLTFESSPGMGTTVALEIPCPFES